LENDNGFTSIVNIKIIIIKKEMKIMIFREWIADSMFIFILFYLDF